MASFLDKMKINTAVTERTRMPFFCSHTTTSNFMEFSVAMCQELTPKQPFKVNQQTFVRLEPMPVPTMGNAKVNNRAFFVPYRTVWPVFNDFYNDVKVVDDNGVPVNLTSVPTISDLVFIDFLDNDQYSISVSEDEVADFVIVSSNSSSVSRRRFTRLGKYYYKLFRQLGYTIDFNQSNSPLLHSALPLLGAAKVYYDWYSQSSYANDARFLVMQAIFNRRTSYQLSLVDLQNLLTFFPYVNYDSDYFVSAWDNPAMPNDGASTSNFVITDITNGSSSSYGRQIYSTSGASTTGAGSSPVISGLGSNGSTVPAGVGNLGALSQYALNALRSLTDYMKRHQLAGARTLDRMLAQWGVKLDAAKLDRSLYLGSRQQPVLFGDVTSTSDTDGANLGSYAGKGVAFNDSSFDYTNDQEFGLFFIISTIVPDISYYQGEDRQNMRLSRLDFYQPEFDNLGVQAISKRELLCPLDGRLTAEIGSWNNQVFGFTPRYSDYKIMRDKITGDYVTPSLATGKDSWFLGRDVSSFVDDSAPQPMQNLVHSIFFADGMDSEQYNRIFYNTDGLTDKFNVRHTFEGTSTFPGKSLFDTYDFEDKGDKVTIDVNGVKVN